MMNTKTIVAGVIGGIVYFLLGWLIYGMLMSDFFEANSGSATGVMRADDEMIMWALALALRARAGSVSLFQSFGGGRRHPDEYSVCKRTLYQFWADLHTAGHARSNRHQ